MCRFDVNSLPCGISVFDNTFRTSSFFSCNFLETHYGQREGVQLRTVIDRVHVRAQKAAVKYRVARAALVALRGGGTSSSTWEDQLRPLLDEDVRSYVDASRIQQGPGRRGTVEEDAEVQEDGGVVEENYTKDVDMDIEVRGRRDGTGETRKHVSWIWTTSAIAIGDSTDDNDDVLRSE